ncbi:MAG: response regulator [Acidobacteria bacterium]|nr:response regulator [Acidobacteriota bacterium]
MAPWRCTCDSRDWFRRRRTNQRAAARSTGARGPRRRARFQIVAECAHGAEAVASIRNHGPDLLLLDVQMPGMDGFDILRAIGVSAVPAVVFVTAPAAGRLMRAASLPGPDRGSRSQTGGPGQSGRHRDRPRGF